MLLATCGRSTLVNEFAEGVFPAVGEVLTEVDKAAIALRHIIVEGYIGRATVGFDGNPAQGTIGGDQSDDTTPGVPVDAPHKFIYNTMINPNAVTPPCGNGVDDDKDGTADDGCPGGVAKVGDSALQRGAAIGMFLDLRASLRSMIEYADTKPAQRTADHGQQLQLRFAQFESVKGTSCNFGTGISDDVESALDAIADIVNCPAALLELGWNLASATLSGFLDFVATSLEALATLVYKAYISAWIDDIDRGLAHWNELSLAVTRALFDPQAYRNTQNDSCFGPEGSTARVTCEEGIGTLDVLFHEADPFVNEYLLSMAGLPDIVGDIRGILQELAAQFDFILDQAFGALLNPIRSAIGDVKAAIRGLILDAIEEATGVDIELLKSFLTHPTYWLNVTDVTLTLPKLGSVSFKLFEEDTHEKLDAYLALGANHHTGEYVPGLVESTRLTDDAVFSETGFAAFKNSVTTAKLLLLNGSTLNQALGNSLVSQGILKSAASVKTYPTTGANLMFTALDGGLPWLRSIDSDHSWRSNAQPVFPNRPAAENAGNGQFPVWESCLLRPAFRKLYTDWENSGANFPDLGDPMSADASAPNAPTFSIAIGGTKYSSGGTTWVARNHSFTVSTSDAIFTPAYVEAQYRTYPTGTTPGAWQALPAGGGTFSLPTTGTDGRWKVEYRAGNPCHTLNETDALTGGATQSIEVILDTTPPVITITKPVAGSIFDTDDLSNIVYSVTDGALGSGVATQPVTFDGAAATNGQLLDMFFLNPGVHTILVTSTDKLGNASSLKRTFEVHATSESIGNNLTRACSLGLIKKGVCNGLTAKTDAALKAHQRGQHSVEWNNLGALINLLEAQRGKGVDTATANRFIAYAKDLIALKR